MVLRSSFYLLLGSEVLELINNSNGTEREKLKMWVVFIQNSPVLFKLFIR